MKVPNHHGAERCHYAPIALRAAWVHRRLRLSLALPVILIMGVLAACKPTVHDFMLEAGQAFQPYVTGDVHTAKSALLAEQKVIARHEAARTPGFDFHGAYLITYSRLCAVHWQLGDTPQAQEYFQRAMTHRSLKRYAPTGEVTMETLLASIRNLDATINPKWRQEK